MIKARSWVVSGKQSAYLLQHEQGHYDIVWILARTLCRRLVEIEWDSGVIDSLIPLPRPLKPPKNYDPKIEPIRQQIQRYRAEYESEAVRLKDLYDDPQFGTKNADNSPNPNFQAVWNQMINYAIVNDTDLSLLIGLLHSLKASTRDWNNVPLPAGGANP